MAEPHHTHPPAMNVHVEPSIGDLQQHADYVCEQVQMEWDGVINFFCAPGLSKFGPNGRWKTRNICLWIGHKHSLFVKLYLCPNKYPPPKTTQEDLTTFPLLKNDLLTAATKGGSQIFCNSGQAHGPKERRFRCNKVINRNNTKRVQERRKNIDKDE